MSYCGALPLRWLGSVVALSKIDNGSAVIVEAYVYDVFGGVTINTGGGSDGNWFTTQTGYTATASQYGNPYMFTGRRYDDETELYYYRARMYSPSIGRFLQTDPIGYGDGMNMYAYVGNNLTGFIDPFGLESKEGGFGFWDGIQGSLEAGGMVPAWGIVPDAINTVISTFRGKWGDALWNLGACIPAGGQFITGGRWTRRGVKAADAAHDAAKVKAARKAAKAFKAAQGKAKELLRNKKFRNWFHKVYKNKQKMGGGGINNSDLVPWQVIEAFEEWVSKGMPMVK